MRVGVESTRIILYHLVVRLTGGGTMNYPPAKADGFSGESEINIENENYSDVQKEE